MATDDINTLRLHTDVQGCVWYGDDVNLGVNSYMEPGDFFDAAHLSFEYDRSRMVRLLGSRSNAGLITRMQERRVRHGLSKQPKICLGSPAVCQTQAARSDPLTVMQYLWQPEMPSSLTCQWHLMTQHDFCTYAMARQYDDVGGIDETVMRTAAYHPAWKALSFVKGLNERAAAALLIEILDPRWYAHYSRVNRLNRLYAYLGLNPHNVAALVDPRQKQGRHFSRAEIAIRTWLDTRAFSTDYAGPMDEPGHFLWRICASQRTLINGILRATERLVSLVCHVWHDAIVTPHPEMGFQPSQFFKTEAEISAFKEHMRSSK